MLQRESFDNFIGPKLFNLDKLVTDKAKLMPVSVYLPDPPLSAEEEELMGWGHMYASTLKLLERAFIKQTGGTRSNWEPSWIFRKDREVAKAEMKRKRMPTTAKEKDLPYAMVEGLYTELFEIMAMRRFGPNHAKPASLKDLWSEVEDTVVEFMDERRKDLQSRLDRQLPQVPPLDNPNTSTRTPYQSAVPFCTAETPLSTHPHAPLASPVSPTDPLPAPISEAAMYRMRRIIALLRPHTQNWVYVRVLQVLRNDIGPADVNVTAAFMEYMDSKPRMDNGVGVSVGAGVREARGAEKEGRGNANAVDSGPGTETVHRAGVRGGEAPVEGEGDENSATGRSAASASPIIAKTLKRTLTASFISNAGTTATTGSGTSATGSSIDIDLNGEQTPIAGQGTPDSSAAPSEGSGSSPESSPRRT